MAWHAWRSKGHSSAYPQLASPRPGSVDVVLQRRGGGKQQPCLQGGSFSGEGEQKRGQPVVRQRSDGKPERSTAKKFKTSMQIHGELLHCTLPPRVLPDCMDTCIRQLCDHQVHFPSCVHRQRDSLHHRPEAGVLCAGESDSEEQAISSDSEEQKRWRPATTSGRCAVCKRAKKGRCGTETAPAKCEKRAENARRPAGDRERGAGQAGHPGSAPSKHSLKRKNSWDLDDMQVIPVPKGALTMTRNRVTGMLWGRSESVALSRVSL